MKSRQEHSDELLNKGPYLQRALPRGIRDWMANNNGNPALRYLGGEKASLPNRSLSRNYLYMAMWPVWRAFLYVFLARLFYNGTLYIFLVLQFLISVHFCGFSGTFAFCNFIAFRELVLNIPSSAIARVFSFAAQTRQLINDYTYVRGLMVLYFLIYIGYSTLIILVIIPLKDVIADTLNAIPTVIQSFPQYDLHMLTSYLIVTSLPLQGLGLGICNFIGTEDRYFLPGTVIFCSVLCILFFQLFFLLSRNSIIAHIQGSSDNLVLMLGGMPQVVFGIIAVVVLIYVTLIGRVPQLRKYNVSLHFRYIYSLNYTMVAKTTVKVATLILQHSIQPLLMLFVQRRISQSSIPFEHYCMQILCLVVYYLLVQFSDTIVLSSNEAYTVVKAVYRQAGYTNQWVLKVLFLGTALVLPSVVLAFLLIYREEVIVLSVPLAFRTYSDFFSMYFPNHAVRYTIAIWTCFIHLITSLFVTYFDVNTMFEESTLYIFLMIVYKYALSLVTVCVTLQHVTSDSALLFIFVVTNVLTIPVYILRALFSYNRKVRKPKEASEKEKAICTNIFHDVLREQ